MATTLHGVRRQGRKSDKFQGTTPQKFDRTKLFDTPRDAAIALAQLKEDIELGIVESKVPKEGAEAQAGSCARRRSLRHGASDDTAARGRAAARHGVCVNRMPLVAAAVLTARQIRRLLCLHAVCGAFLLSRARQQSVAVRCSRCAFGAGVACASLRLAIYICQDYRV